MKQTALEWYAEQEIELTLDFLSKKISELEYGFCRLKLIEQAKEMEREQIIDAWNIGLCIQDTNDICGEYYYNETFKSE